MYKVVRAEERWITDGKRLIGLAYPQILNPVSLSIGLYLTQASTEFSMRAACHH